MPEIRKQIAVYVSRRQWLEVVRVATRRKLTITGLVSEWIASGLEADSGERRAESGDDPEEDQ